MAGGQEISISKALWEGLEGVVHDVSRDEDRQIVVLAAYLDRLAEGYGLSDRHEDELVSRATQQALFLPFVGHYLADGEAVEPERIRNRLYTALDAVDAADCDLVPGLGKITRDSRLKIAQVYWNLSWDGADRPGLPLKPGPLVDGRDKDGQPTHYRTSIWADWVGEDLANHLRVRRIDLVKGGTVGTSGSALRAKGSLLAVLAATRFVRLRGLANSHQLAGAEFRGSVEGDPPTSFGWPAPEQVVLNQVTLNSTPPWGGSFVTVGRPVDPGEGYQRRGFEDEIEGFWGDGRDRRVWLLVERAWASPAQRGGWLKASLGTKARAASVFWFGWTRQMSRRPPLPTRKPSANYGSWAFRFGDAQRTQMRPRPERFWMLWRQLLGLGSSCWTMPTLLL